MSRTTRAAAPPRLSRPPKPPTGEPSPGDRLPAERRRQLRELLGRLLARLHEARRLEEAGRD